MQILWRFGELFFWPVLWGSSVFAALSLRGAVLAGDHTLCGPWGCGPTTDALVSVHAAWVAVIWPPLLFFPWRLHWHRRWVARFGVTLAAFGLLGIVAICGWQWLVWRPAANELVQPYTWQRCGFVLAGAIDWPLVQMLGIGTILWLIHRRRNPRSAPLAEDVPMPSAMLES